MDATTLRLILIVVGVMLILALYLWERSRTRAEDDEDVDDAVHWEDRREPNVDPWDTGPAGLRSRDAPRVSPRSEGRDMLHPALKAQSALKEAEPDLSEPLIIQLSVVSGADAHFDGKAIVKAASTCGLEPGEMDVFHCYLGDEKEQQTLFRVANLVKPGTFPFGAMEGFETPGLVLFASVEGQAGDLAIVDEMVATARCLAEELGGEIRDETRNPFTAAKEDTLRARVLARQMARESEVDGS